MRIFTTKVKSKTDLSKRYWLENGAIKKNAAAQMYSGNAERVTMPFSKFPEVLAAATSKEAVVFGTHATSYPDKVKITTKGSEKPENDTISRTKDFYAYPENQAGVLMIDHDPSEYGQLFNLESLLAKLTEIHPEIAQAARVVRGSVSAGVHLAGHSPRTDKGFHLYMPVVNSEDIPRYGKALFNKLWLRGHGFIALSSSGAMLLRSPIDESVFGSQGLDFSGKPIIQGGGIEYTPPVAEFTDGDMLDTSTLLDLTDDEKTTLKQLQDAAKEAIKPQAAIVQAHWAAEKMAEMVLNGTSESEAKATIERMLSGDNRDLYGEFILTFSSGERVKVSDVLDNPKKYNFKTLADPLEGTQYGTTTAKFYWNNGKKPVVNSQAHGVETKYFLHRMANKFSELLANASDNPDGLDWSEPDWFSDETLHPDWFDEAETTKTSKAARALLSGVYKVYLIGVCESLGWVSRTRMDGSKSNPTPQHFKVAIIHSLIELAKKHRWYIIHDTGFFYIYDKSQWIPLIDAEVKTLLCDAAIKMSYAVIEARNANFVDQLFKQAIHEGFFAERNHKKQSIINLANGSLVLNEDGIKLKDFDHRDFLTHKLDFDYDEIAVNQPLLKFLAEVLPDPETRKTLQQVAGYLFIKGLKMEKIFFLFGTGSNGKSVFFEVINGILGTENVSNYSLESLTNDNGYFRAMIKDKIVNYGSDINLNKIDAGIFKTLASGEPVEARLPFKEPFMMDDYAKLIFNVNRMDNANIEHTHGFYRRLLIIPFNKTIADDQQDRDLHKKILANKAGVINWIIEGARQVISSRDIFISDECNDFKARFLKETDNVAMFEESEIIEHYQLEGYYKTVSDSYKDYKAYCLDAGHRNPLGRNNFTKRMETIGFEKLKERAGWYLKKPYQSPV
ncbi:Phage/plasmid primase, P4 family (modular protein) [Crenothrix polyspora]|uniref:Phage/plasmid primase, P4 family (Modular protein) n=1 Tax=Crenothrix polyspora TaxID=360316 RepID=A0A1R4HI25_9GAMM|nr:Phage/plasmid primase, P4 family (modular protein) [Crenothrix polyspora]